MEENAVDSETEDPIAAAWEDIQSRMQDDEPEEEAPAEEAAPESEEEPKAQSRPRDEHGRFARTEAQASEASLEPLQQEQAAPTGEWDINRPPSSLTPQAKAEWDKLPESWRREIHRREADMHRGIQQVLPDARLGASLRQVVEPYRPYLDASGASPETVVSALLRTDAILRTGTASQKAQMFRQLAQDYGIDLQAAQQQAEAQQQTGYDPRVDQLIAAQRNQMEQQRAAAVRAKEYEVDSWLSETTPEGKPLRPFVENVYSELLALVPAIQQTKPGASSREVLEEAYQRAVWANPATRAVLEQQKLAELEAQRQAENRRKVEDAKKAASVNVARRGVVSPKPADLQMPDFIAQEAQRLGLLA